VDPGGCDGQADSAVPGRGDSVEPITVATVWTQRRRRGHKKFWQPDGVEVKIIQLGFKDRAARGFIGEPQ
jgi:hypothetical protein